MNPWLSGLLHALIMVAIMLTNGAFTIYLLRKVLGYSHLRYGPTELGPGGIAQLIPDVLKLLTKEDRHPGKSDKWLYIIAPFIVFIPAFMAYMAIPFSDKLIALDLNMGVLALVGFLTVAPLGIFAAGWGSHNKLSLLGAMRSIGGAISYEIPLLLSMIPPIMVVGSLSLKDIVLKQADNIWFFLPMLPMVAIFFISSLNETSQAPFDMAESESELVSGFNTEYSAMRFGLMYLAEFSNNFIMAGIMVSLFFGGWTLPFIDPLSMGAFAPLVFVLKTYLVIICFMLVRGTFSRVRVDMLAAFGWKFMLPVSLGFVMISALVVMLLKQGGVL